MKQFEKWLDSQPKEKHDTVQEIAMFDLGAKLAWKAALDWVLNYLDHSQEHKQIEDIIYKELEN